MGVDTQLLGQPINKEAALVTGKGFSHEWINKQRPHVKSWDHQPPVRNQMPNQHNYAGIKFGRMHVVGLAKEHKKRWVVRRACGTYELRSAKSIDNQVKSPRPGTASNGMCSRCIDLLSAQKREAKQRFYKKHGIYPNESNGPEARKFMEKFG